MKLNQDFVLRQIADTWVILALGDTSVSFNGMLKLNDSGALLWHELEKGGDRAALEDVLTREYAVSRQQAEQDVDAFLRKLAAEGCLTE